ncbi:MAG: 2-isopropylmalate synthase [Treponema sp.]|nr:2-isopropylmalate synthase [Treponema sp.]
MRPLHILDTTLRDGDQAAGFAFSPAEKRALARALIEAGVDTVETGFPLSSPADFELCRSLAEEFPGRTAVMCRGRREDIAATAKIFAGGIPGLLHISLPVSEIHIRAKLGISGGELLRRAAELAAYAAGLVSDIELGAEDATRAERQFLADYCAAAFAAGVKIVNIADTLGIAGPGEFGGLTAFLRDAFPGSGISVHCHNDLGLALANTLAAVEAGCDQAEVSAGGIGERAGNAALEELCLNLHARPARYGVSAGLRREKLKPLIALLRDFSAIDSPLKPVWGWNTRSHASGIHQQGLSRETETYANPALAGMHREGERIGLSRHSGRAGLRLFAQRYCGLELKEDILGELMRRLKAAPGPLLGLTEFLCMLGDLEALPPDRRRPLVCRSFSETIESPGPDAGEGNAGNTAADARTGKNLPPAAGTAVNSKTTARHAVRAVLAEYGSEGRAITLEGAGENQGAAVLEALRPVGGGGLSIVRTGLCGAGPRLRLYAELTLGERRFALERRGGSTGAMLFACCLDALNGGG